MKEFTLFWLDGKSEIITGTDIQNAFSNAGLSNGSLRVLDFWDTGNTLEDWEYIKENRSWKRKAQTENEIPDMHLIYWLKKLNSTLINKNVDYNFFIKYIIDIDKLNSKELNDFNYIENRIDIHLKLID